MKVEATDEYVKRNVRDEELKRIPKKGETFEVSKERYEVLNGKNPYNVKFVELVEEVEDVDAILSRKATKTTKKDK